MHFQTVFSFVFPKSRTKDHHEPRAGYATETKIFEFLENDWNRFFLPLFLSNTSSTMGKSQFCLCRVILGPGF